MNPGKMRALRVSVLQNAQVLGCCSDLISYAMEGELQERGIHHGDTEDTELIKAQRDITAEDAKNAEERGKRIIA